jgi:hypothetical protein
LLLENIPAEKKELEEISAFITSIFDSTHIPISTSGSNAFSRYCRAKFGSEVGQSACPRKILNVWRAYAEATGDFIPTSPSTVDNAFDREVHQLMLVSPFQNLRNATGCVGIVALYQACGYCPHRYTAS